MKKLGLVKIVAIMLVLVATAAIASEIVSQPKKASWRYKMTVEIDTPEGLKTGSAVREVTIEDVGGVVNPSMAGFRSHVKGEAIAVDLGKRGVVFALMKGVMTDYGENIVFYAFPLPGEPPGVGGATSEGMDYYSSLEAKTSLTPVLYPTMVMFSNPSDPKTVKMVFDTERYEQPQGAGSITKKRVKEDNFETVFGTGVKIKDVKIEMTKDPVSQGVAEYLPWLKEIETKKARLNGSTSIAISTNELSDNLGPGSFRRGQ